MAMVHARMAQHGTCVFAHEQTKGKGQRSKQWISNKDENIILSIIVAPYGLPPAQQFSLSMAVALGVYRFFNHYAGDETRIKWPNDLYWRDRKAGGILIENSLQGNSWQWAVIGIGINLNQTQFPELENKAVSLKQITGKSFDPEAMAKELVQYVQAALVQLTTDNASIRKDYHSCLYKINESIMLRQGSRNFKGTMAGVAPTGELLVNTPLEERFSIGEVEWIMGQ